MSSSRFYGIIYEDKFRQFKLWLLDIFDIELKIFIWISFLERLIFETLLHIISDFTFLVNLFSDKLKFDRLYQLHGLVKNQEIVYMILI